MTTSIPYRTWSNIKQRCNNPNATSFKSYGGKGIKCFLTLQEIETLWERDHAENLKQASIDRINSKGHYTFDNCRFIEMSENRKRGGRKNRILLSLTENDIRILESLSVGRTKSETISAAIRLRYKKVYGNPGDDI